jgi:5-deoxy-D-glucuronate isomerase
VLRSVELEAREIDLSTLVEYVKTITMAGKGSGAYHPFAYMGGYKAVYLLMADL